MGTANVNIGANVAGFVGPVNLAAAAVGRLQGAVGQMAAHGATELQSMSGLIRTMEGRLDNNIRAAERFGVSILGLGRFAQAAFPVVGALAMVGALGSLAERAAAVVEWFKELREAPLRAQAAFGEMASSLQVTNDQLQVTNDKLEIQIAKLERRPLSGMKLAADEATLAVDKLGASLEKTVAELIKIGKETDVDWWKGAWSNQTQTGNVTDQMKRFQKEQYDIDETVGYWRSLAKPGDLKAQGQIDQDDLTMRLHSLKLEQDALKKSLDIEREYKRVRDETIAAHPNSPLESFLVPGNEMELLHLQGEYVGVSAKIEEARRTQTEMSDQSRLAALQAAEPARQAREFAADKLKEFNDAEAKAQLLALNAGNIVGEKMAGAYFKVAEAIDEVNKKREKAGMTKLGFWDQYTSDLYGVAASTASTEAATEAGKKQRQFLATMGRAGDLAQDVADNPVSKELADSWKETMLRGAQQAKRNVELSIDQAKTQGDVGEYGAVFGSYDEQVAAARRSKLLTLQARGALVNGPTHDEITAEMSAFDVEALRKRKEAGFGMNSKDGYKAFTTDLVNNFKSAGYQIQQLMGGVFSTLGDQFTSFLSGAKVSWSSFFQSLASSFAKAGINTMFGLLGGWMKGGGLGNLLSSIGGIFKADGGPVMGGSPYVVGEQGPEWFVPGSNGSIVPNGAMGGGGVYYNIDARGTDPQTTERNVRRALQLTHTSAVQNGVMATQEMTRRRPR